MQYLFFSFGGGEIFVILIIILMLFGSKKIPELARGIGKGIREVKDATNDIQREITKGVEDKDNNKS
ncbi:MAG: twin-arginine translocase TatA/TatE family subunit [Flavobacteriales bacterium]|nr:twin-arginine translocase TatA/TatE family subunit [Flavobacteriales bacterium]